MIQTAIIDDDPAVLRDLSQKLNAYFAQNSIPAGLQAFTSGRDLLSCEKTFDLIFLDIQMDGLNGMETAKLLRAHGFSSFLIFITALPEYVYDAFEVDASDYLLKPVSEGRLHRLLDRICGKISRTDNHSLVLTSRQSPRVTIPFRDITYCEAVNHTIEVHAKGAVYKHRIKIEELAAQVDARFFRCHRSYLVNLAHVCGYENGLALLTDGDQIPVSRLRKREFSQAVLRYMKEAEIS